MSVPHCLHHFDAVWIWQAEARSPAGDAAESLKRILGQQPALSLDPVWGWIGPVSPPTGLLELAHAVADPCWQQALAMQPLSDPDNPAAWPGLIMSVSKGDTGAWLSAADLSQAWARHGIPGCLSARLAADWGQRFFRGAPPVGACASGLLAILEAARLVQQGSCPWAIAGAADRSLQPLLLGGFRNLGVSCGAHLPAAHAGQATGFALAEGAAALALGPRPAAGTSPWRICGGASLGDASHETRCDDPQALGRLLSILWELCPQPEMIICHGTGTAAGDALESAALAAGPWRQIPRLCCKPIIGHSLGANAAVELAIGLHGPWRSLWKLSLGFGGHLAGLACQR
ncbi:MAG: hypothetical protein EA402_04670 [Planctomycetota bacterium]|nr:MAG: hypothetical protein EA402_04670 [Planctomycetota bacterium]